MGSIQLCIEEVIFGTLFDSSDATQEWYAIGTLALMTILDPETGFAKAMSIKHDVPFHILVGPYRDKISYSLAHIMNKLRLEVGLPKVERRRTTLIPSTQQATNYLDVKNWDQRTRFSSRHHSPFSPLNRGEEDWSEWIANSVSSNFVSSVFGPKLDLLSKSSKGEKSDKAETSIYTEPTGSIADVQESDSIEADAKITAKLEIWRTRYKFPHWQHQQTQPDAPSVISFNVKPNLACYTLASAIRVTSFSPSPDLFHGTQFIGIDLLHPHDLIASQASSTLQKIFESVPEQRSNTIIALILLLQDPLNQNLASQQTLHEHLLRCLSIWKEELVLADEQSEYIDNIETLRDQTESGILIGLAHGNSKIRSLSWQVTRFPNVDSSIGLILN